MLLYRRARVAGGTYFFTVVRHRRRRLFHDEANRTLLGEVIRDCQRDWPFEMNAVVLLPEHLHANWTLPAGDDNDFGRWSTIKKDFTQRFLAAGGTDWKVSDGTRREDRRAIWQPRFGEHVIQDEDDFDVHFDYIHDTPVKHKLTRCPSDWGPTSFHRWVQQGAYAPDWACGKFPAPQIPVTTANYGEDYGDQKSGTGSPAGACPTLTLTVKERETFEFFIELLNLKRMGQWFTGVVE
ncbi:MAG: transposase [Planctomycetaceae bacterium]